MASGARSRAGRGTIPPGLAWIRWRELVRGPSGVSAPPFGATLHVMARWGAAQREMGSIARGAVGRALRYDSSTEYWVVT